MILKLTLLAPFLIQQQGVGGWHHVRWRPHTTPETLSADWIPDATGDGAPDLLEYDALSGSLLQVVDPATGEAWYSFRPEERSAVIATGDVDGDGLTDLVIGDRTHAVPSGSYSEHGRVLVVEGGSGRVSWEWVGAHAGARLGLLVDLADLDGDGDQDVLARAGYTSIHAYRGDDGSMLWTHASPSGGFALPVVDVTGDGAQDVLFAELGSALELLDGRTGASVWVRADGLEDSTRGEPVLAHDLDGDGTDDLIVSMPAAADGRGAVRAFSGRNGSLLWQRRGGGKQNGLGAAPSLEDVDGDGFPEYVSVNKGHAADPGYIHVHDARTGARLWRERWQEAYRGEWPYARVDLNGDGRREFVFTHYRDGYRIGTVRALDPATGVLVWPAEPLFLGGSIETLVVGQADSDGLPDLFIAGRSIGEQNEGLVAALSGATGQVIWSREDVPDGGMGRAMTAADLGGPASTVFATNRDDSPRYGVMAFDGATGAELWFTARDPRDNEVHSLRTLDLNGDARPELIGLADGFYSRSDPPFASCWHADDGRFLWASMRLLHRPLWQRPPGAWIGAPVDSDGDGWLDPILSVEGGGLPGGQAATGISGRYGTWDPGVRLSQDTISAATGGQRTLEIHTEERFADKEYRLLFSENGVGSTLLGSLEVPLASGAWLWRSAVDIYPPGVFTDPTGRLDADARGQIILDLTPAQLSRFVGRSLACAVVTYSRAAHPPKWTSGYVLLTVTP